MKNLLLILPETILFVTAFVIFTLDLARKQDQKDDALSPLLAVIGAFGAFGAAAFLSWQGNFTLIATSFDGSSNPMLAADQFAFFFKAYAALTVGLIGLLSTDYVRARTPFQGEFYALTLLAGLSLMLLASSVNLVMIFLSFEFLSIISYILTGYLRDDKRSIEAAVKYFLYGAAASAVMLYGFSLIYGASGSLDLSGIATGLAKADPTVFNFMVVPAMILIIVGLGFKIGLVPFHQWAPEAYEGAPTPITTFLSVGPKASGLALMVRIMVLAFPQFADTNNVNWVLILSAIAMLTMSVGNLVAIWQKDIKRLFAYSSIAQAGYMLIGVVAIAPGFLDASQTHAIEHWSHGLNGLLLYLLAYLFTNIGAFGIIIALENKSGSSKIVAYAGLFKRSPFLAIAFFIFLLSLVGIPPTAGFIGKFFLFAAALEQQMLTLAIVGIVNSVISVYYYFYIVREMFFEEPQDTSPIPVSFGHNLSIVAMVILVLIGFAVLAEPFVVWTQNSAQIIASGF